MRLMNAVRLGTYLALTAALISGIANFISKIAVTAIKDPVLFTTLKNALVAVFLISGLVLFKKLSELKTLNRKDWLMLISVGLVGGALPFALFFSGLEHSSAINAGLIHKSLFLWVAILAIPILGEKFSGMQWLGVGALFAANLFVGGFAGFKFNFAELLILFATILWAIESIIAKIALKNISSLTVASARMVFGSLALLIYLSISGAPFNAITSLNQVEWGWTLLSSLFLLGYVTTWYSALKMAPASHVAALLVPATLITNILSAVFVQGTLPFNQVASSALLLLGVLFVIVFAKTNLPKTAPLKHIS
ncbi:DMT family transporter [Candidatus Giovannonibacteria bacterium]|nr:DMT family transporter [Candidatus Giovannonibacteria bacterium]